MIKNQKLFIASCIAITATAMTFAIRAELIDVLGKQFCLSSEDIGFVSGTAFWGFTLSMIIGGLIVDKIGMKNIIYLAAIGHVVGIILTIYSTGFWSLFISTMFVGIANGFVEAAVNPLVATIYPKNKTGKLNLLHVWFPAGIVIGGLIVHYFRIAELSWKWQMAMILLPTVAYGALFFPLSFPPTERVSSGVSSKGMFKALLRPLFLVMVFCMLLSAATELGTNQWIPTLLKSATSSPIILLVFINGIMVVGRLNAGKIEHAFSTTGMLLFSAVFSTLGLVLFGYLERNMVFIAAAVFAVGICFFWPTMLAFVSKYFPETGAMGLSIMGGAGMLSISVILPLMGYVYDGNISELVPSGQSLDLLKNAQQGTAEAIAYGGVVLQAGKSTLLNVAVLPTILVVIFGILFIAKPKQLNGK